MQWVLRFADLLAEGLKKRLADVQGRGDQLIECWLDVGNDSTVFGFFEYLQASHDGDSLSEGFTSGLALIDEEGRALLFGQSNGLAFSMVSFEGS